MNNIFFSKTDILVFTPIRYLDRFQGVFEIPNPTVPASQKLNMYDFYFFLKKRRKYGNFSFSICKKKDHFTESEFKKKLD